MKLVKSLLLGSAAGLAAVAGAQAADLPVRKAAPVEYVRVCTAYGAGFFFIPGTDTCLRVSGRARYEYNVSEVTNRRQDVTGSRAIGRVGLDARTATAFGTLRTFVRIDIARRTGTLFTGSGFRVGTFFGGAGEFANVGTQVVLDQAYVQLAGFTAGRTDSFFDFFPTYPNFIGTIGSVSTTTGFWYTAALGSGIDLTVGVEDQNERKFAIAGNAFGIAINPATGLLDPAFSGTFDPIQRSRMPDFVAALRVTQPWGNAQLSGVVHQMFVGGPALTVGTVGVPTFVPPIAGLTSIPTNVVTSNTQGFAPDSEYGFAIQGGVKVNLPMLAAGDALIVAAAYADGATNYVLSDFVGNPQSTAGSGTSGRIQAFSVLDGVVNGLGEIKTTEAYMVRAGLLHYFTPTLRTGLQVGYGRIEYDESLRNPFFGVRGSTGLGVSGAASGIGIFDATFRDTNLYVAAANLIYSPVRDLDIGVEVLYTRADPKGRVIDINDGITGTPGIVNFAGLNFPAVNVPGIGLVPVKTRDYDDNFTGRFRVQRDF